MTRTVPVSFVITRSEMSHELDNVEIANLSQNGERFWEKVQECLTAYARRYISPSEDGYDKTDFAVTFSDGHTYDGRLDVMHPDRADAIACDLDVATHLTRNLEHHAGRRCPTTMTEERYKHFLASVVGPERQEQAADMLDGYALTSRQLRTQVALDPNLDPRRRRVVDAFREQAPTSDEILANASDDLLDRVAAALKDAYLDNAALDGVHGGDGGNPDVSDRSGAVAFLESKVSNERLRESVIAFGDTEELERIVGMCNADTEPEKAPGMTT